MSALEREFEDASNVELVIAFAMACDRRGLSYERGVIWAEELGEELAAAAEDRQSYAPREAGT